MRGIGLDARLLTNKEIIFDDIPAGDKSHIKALVWKNEGNIPLVIDNVFVKPGGSPFLIDPFSTVPDSMHANEEGEYVKLRFWPKMIDSFHDSLIIIYHDSSLTCFDDTIIVDLIGNGVEHKIEHFPLEALDFDSVHAIKLPKEDTLFIKNISTRFTVWVDSQLLQKNEMFRILNPHSFRLAPYNGITYHQDTLQFEFYIDPIKELKTLLKSHEDYLDIYYRYGNPHPDSIKFEAIRPDTLTGTIISSIRVNGDSALWKPVIPINTSLDTSFMFQNTGNIPLYFEIINSPDNPPWDLSFDINTIYELEADKQEFLKIFFSPQDTSDSDFVRIYFWDFNTKKDTCIRDTVTISLIGIGIDNIRPIIDSVKYSQPIWNQPDTVKAKVYDEHSGLRQNTPFLFIRSGGDFDFSPIKMEKTGNLDSTFFAIIPGEKITSKGIEFFIEAVDNSKTEGHYPPIESEFHYLSTPVTITAPGITKRKDYLDNGEIDSLHGGNAQQDYRLISIPLELDSTNRSVVKILKGSLFSEYHEHRWSCADYVWNQNDKKYSFIHTNSYEENYQFADFIPGKSFFLLITYRYPKQFLKPQTGKTITTAQIFKYPLHTEWNLIANPFNFPIPRKNVGLISEETLEILNYEGNWEPVGIQDILKPWQGYAVINKKEDIDTLLICPNMNLDYGPTELSNILEKPAYQWYISIESFCRQAKDSYNIAAVSKGALEQYDNYDEFEPLAIGDYVMLSFPHPDWEKAIDYFSVDVQPPDQNGNFWDFSVLSNIADSEVKLTFKNLESVPDKFQISLVCKNLGTFQDLRQSSNFVYKSDKSKSEQKFRLLVGTSDFVADNNLNIEALPKTYQLDASYPNPFNSTASIRYSLPQQDQVTIAIFNILGELVKTIEQKAAQPAGTYSVAWDGTNQNGVLVSNGIYFCRFTTPNFSKTIKMTLLK